jgi:methyl-accepting chemotaxis protein
MSLFKKAAIAFGVLALLTIVGESVVVAQASSSATGIASYRERTAAYQTAVRGMITNWYVYDDQNNMYVLVAATAPANHKLVEDTFAQGTAAVALFSKDLAVARAAAPAADAALLDKVGSDFTAYEGFARRARSSQQAGDVATAARLTTVDNLAVSNQLMADLTQAEQQSDAGSTVALQALTDRQTTMRGVAIGVGIAVVLGLVLLAGFFLRGVLAPLSLLGRRMQNIATGDGDLTARVDESRGDEIGDMGRSFNLFIGRIQGVMVAFSESIVALLAASNALRAITVDTAANADRTAVTARSAAASAEQVATHITTVAAGANELGDSINEIAQNAAHAATVAGTGRERALETAERVQRLATSSSEIDSVVRMITAIAEQTNLLALNATIEAARAGDAGKGFAVVASEVKQLAAETAAATKDITRKVAAIQADTEQAVLSVGAITAVIEEISGIQQTIAAAVEQQNATTTEITRSAADVAGNAQAITGDVAAVAVAVGATSTGVTASSDTIEELAQLSASLDHLITQFKIT